MNESEKEEKELWQQAAKSKGEERVEALLKLSYTAFGKGNHEESLALCETAKEEYELLGAAGSTRTMAHIYYGMAWSFNSLSQTAKAIEAMEKSLTLYREIGSTEQVINALKSVGDFWFSAKDYKKAFETYQLILLEPSPDIPEIDLAWAFDNSGRAAQKLHLWDVALDNFLQARELVKKLKRMSLLAHIDEEISWCHSKLGNGIEAEYFARKAMDYAITAEDQYHLIWSKARIATSLRVQAKLDEALALMTEAKSAFVNSEDMDWRGVLFMEKERQLIFGLLGNYEEADAIGRRIEAISETILEDGEEI